MPCRSEPSCPLDAGQITAIDSDGAVDSEIYAGAQPDLIEGVSTGPAWETLLVRHLYRVNPRTIALTIEARNVQSHPLIPYEPQPGDVLRDTSAGMEIPERFLDIAFLESISTPAQRARGTASAWPFIDRNGVPLGWRVGFESNWLWPVQPMLGKPLDTAWADAPGSYRLVSTDDPHFASATAPSAVHRKSRPHHKGSDGPSYNGESGEHHRIYLVFDHSLTPGRHYEVGFSGRHPSPHR